MNWKKFSEHPIVSGLIVVFIAWFASEVALPRNFRLSDMFGDFSFWLQRNVMLERGELIAALGLAALVPAAVVYMLVKRKGLPATLEGPPTPSARISILDLNDESLTIEAPQWKVIRMLLAAHPDVVYFENFEGKNIAPTLAHLERHIDDLVDRGIVTYDRDYPASVSFTPAGRNAALEAHDFISNLSKKEPSRG